MGIKNLIEMIPKFDSLIANSNPIKNTYSYLMITIVSIILTLLSGVRFTHVSAKESAIIIVLWLLGYVTVLNYSHITRNKNKKIADAEREETEKEKQAIADKESEKDVRDRFKNIEKP